MHEFPTGMIATSRTAKKRTDTRHDVSAGVHLCLVVSPSAERAKLFEQAAELQHWHTIVSHEADEALRLAARYHVHLAMVDLQYVAPPDQQSFRELVKRLATTDGPLLVVCGRENDVKSEIWSRKLGVWMYLPGVAEQTNLSLLCAQAKSVVERFEQRDSRAPKISV